jgi:hypothetical protein
MSTSVDDAFCLQSKIENRKSQTMPRFRHTLRFPSYRNLLIYHELACERLTQTALAKRLGLSQERVSQIARQVKAWVDRTVRPRQLRSDEGGRFHLAIAYERLRLRDAYAPLVSMFTGSDGLPRYLRRHITVLDGQPLNTVEVSEKQDFRLLNQAVDVMGRQAELESIANRGPFAELIDDVHQTIVHRFEPTYGPTTDEASCMNANENREGGF